MALKNLISLWTLSLCVVADKVPSITDSQFIDECLQAHNELRGSVNPPAADMKHMFWDESLAKLAKEWTTECKFEHRSCLSKPYKCTEDFQFVGENIWLGGFPYFSPKSSITAWYNETAFYDFDTKACSKVCGHYTQVVWAKSYKVGCAVSICPNLGTSKTSIFVCNYGPAGNFVNVSPYTKGEPCSMCAEGEKCVNKLCHAERPGKGGQDVRCCTTTADGDVVGPHDSFSSVVQPELLAFLTGEERRASRRGWMRGQECYTEANVIGAFPQCHSSTDHPRYPLELSGGGSRERNLRNTSECSPDQNSTIVPNSFLHLHASKADRD
uniref:GLIPR1-like protein 1 isoform X1 n=1 Tax=Ictidomys tridecemlineatus TaxID=43179 RepID=UPI001A9DBF07|nr:GLIPR1-like protein 1 isoform X1 [Ictidomys tridecemlineatus]